MRNVLKVVGGPKVRDIKVLDAQDNELDKIKSITIDRIDVYTAQVTAIIKTAVEIDISFFARDKDDLEENCDSS